MKKFITNIIIYLNILFKGYYIENFKVKNYPEIHKLFIYTKHNILAITDKSAEYNSDTVVCRMYHTSQQYSHFVKLISHINYYYVRDEIMKRKTLDDIFCFLYQVFE